MKIIKKYIKQTQYYKTKTKIKKQITKKPGRND